jgi:hypothetical protein
MITKKEERKTCDKCGAIHIERDCEYSCDECKKNLKTNDDNGNWLSITTFNEGDENNTDYEFCSWLCLLEFLNKNKSLCNWFISTPHISFEKDNPLNIDNLFKDIFTFVNNNGTSKLEKFIDDTIFYARTERKKILKSLKKDKKC